LGSTLVAIAGLDERLAEIKSSISVLPSAPDLEQLVEEHGSAKRAVADTEAKSTAADEAEITARQLFEQIEQQMGGQKWFTDVDRVMQEGNRVISDMAALEKRMVEDQQIVETMVPQVEALQRKYIEAEAQLISARQALHQAHIDDSAGVIRSTLSKDQPCPVCEQIVKSLPASQASPNVKSSESAVVHAEKAAASSRSELEEAGKRKGIAENRVQVTKGDLDEIKVRVADISVALAGLVGTADPTVELKRRQDLLDGAKTAHNESAKLRQAASAAAATSRKTLQVVEASVAKVTSVLDRACGLLRVTRSTDDLGGTCKLVLDAAASIEVDLSRQVVALKEQRQKALDIIEGFRSKFAAVSGTADEVLAEAVVAHSTAVRAVHDLEQVISKAKEAEALSLVLRKEKANYERLKMDFSDAKFLTYLLEKQRKILSQLASDKFFELTGCYTFDSDGEFQIIDVRTGDTRAPDTLSGGETFLASLALALALAEAVALGGARLDCFFLDEGFGSLDRESLDLAMQGIENLAQPGRLIGVISHIPGIQQALDDLIVLDKSQDGTTVVIQHEGPIGYEPMLI
ncbi:MAG: SbcC/MukB-like Walker B domain-containing protein, partial [Actinomycetota bacterium]